MAWNVFKIDSSKIGFYQNFLIYCDKFDNKIIYCLSRFRAGNFSPAPTSNSNQRRNKGNFKQINQQDSLHTPIRHLRMSKNPMVRKAESIK